MGQRKGMQMIGMLSKGVDVRFLSLRGPLWILLSSYISFKSHAYKFLAFSTEINRRFLIHGH